VDINEEGLREVAEEIGRKGGEAAIYRVDISDRSQVEALAGDVEPQVLVNCAAILLMADFEDTSPEDWERILSVNLMGPINMIRAFLPALKASRGHVVIFSSGAGMAGNPGYGAYSVSKFGLMGLSEVLDAELAGHGIRVTVVCPGYTWTPIYDQAVLKGYNRKKVARAFRLLSPIWFTTPEKLVPKVIAAIKKDQALLAHTFFCKFAYYLKRFSPWLQRKIAVQYYRMEKSWKG
jgi:NAD(P)-dependent dehydrogenase (short-subunit alcohol dehydrogenase family)